MRFVATFRLAQLPHLVGHSQNSKRNEDLENCHEFSVCDVKCDMSKMKYFSTNAAEVSLAARAYSQNALHGPASLRESRVIVYPCKKFRCRVPCPCHKCRVKVNHCEKTENNETCGDCTECRADYNDHLLFHRAVHLSCKFCTNISQHIPNFKFVICELAGYWPELFEKQTSAYVFIHIQSSENPHLKPKHDQLSNRQCDKCEKKFKTIRDLRRHERSIHYLEKYHCIKCGSKFTRKDNMEVHMTIAHSEADHDFQCQICNSTFSKKCNYDRHCKLVSRKCDFCSKDFCSIKQFQQHIKKEHSEHSCDSCNKCFPDRAQLKRHIEAAQSTPAVFVHHCVECDNNFCTSQSLVRHMKTHVTTTNECQYCKKTFSTKWRLKKHLLNRKESSCENCGDVLCNGFDLKQHNYNAHIRRVCRFCNNGHYDPANYKLHMYQKHQELVE